MNKWSAIPECPCQAEGHAQKRQTHIQIGFPTYSVYRIQPFIYLFISMYFNSDLLVFIYCIFTLKCLLMGPTPGMPSFKNSATGTPFISVTVPVQLLHYLIILSKSTVSGWYILLWSYILISFIWYFMQNTCTHGSWALCISIVCSFPTPFPDERAVRTKSKLQYKSPLDPGV